MRALSEEEAVETIEARAVLEGLAARYPRVIWRPDLFVTEDSRLLCSGGLYAAMDISLYLVEKLCGHEVAVQTAKSLLLPMPRLSQTGYAMLPVSRPHEDGRIAVVVRLGKELLLARRQQSFLF